MSEGERRRNNGHSNNLPPCTKVACKTRIALSSALFSPGVARSNCLIAAEVNSVRYCETPTTAQTAMWNHDLCKFSRTGWTNI